jgi:hypothetical protein
MNVTEVTANSGEISTIFLQLLSTNLGGFIIRPALIALSTLQGVTESCGQIWV